MVHQLTRDFLNKKLYKINENEKSHTLNKEDHSHNKIPEEIHKDEDRRRGLGIGDWGLGIGDWPNPQSPIPNPQSPT
jgi:hypothetical protein